MTILPRLNVATYRKEMVLPPGKGWGRLKNPQETDPKKQIWLAGRLRAPLSVLVHATHGAQGSKFHNEAAYLRDSASVSAQYCVSKTGDIAQILDDMMVAWHAGQVCYPDFDNLDSIGVELHASAIDVITDAQKNALAWLCRSLMARWIIAPAMINTHRWAACPPGRKFDPGGWSQDSFMLWRKQELNG